MCSKILEAMKMPPASLQKDGAFHAVRINVDENQLRFKKYLKPASLLKPLRPLIIGSLLSWKSVGFGVQGSRIGGAAPTKRLRFFFSSIKFWRKCIIII